MTGAQPWLLFADLDGTLIAEPKGMGRELRKLVEASLRNGGGFVPASARPVPHLAAMFGKSAPGSLLIGSGGATVARSTPRSFEVLHEEALDLREGAAPLGRMLEWRDEGLGIVFFFRGHRAAFEVAVAAGSCRLQPDDLAMIVGRRPMREVTAPPHGDLLGVSLLAPSPVERMRRLQAALPVPDGWRVTAYPEYRAPGWSWLEVLPRHATKAEACRRVIGLWREKAGGEFETIAVGDAPDDVGMLAVAERSFCPIDASAAAREAVTEVLPAAAGEDFAAALLERLSEPPG